MFLCIIGPATEPLLGTILSTSNDTSFNSYTNPKRYYYSYFTEEEPEA